MLKIAIHTAAVLLLAVTTTAVPTANAQADDRPTQAASIDGYSPVSYFTVGKAERGDPKYAVEHDAAVYYLTSAEQVDIFWQDPDKYRPRHRACPYSLAHGMVLPLDPENFKIVGDSLLLFHRSEEKDAQLEWNNSTLSEEELLRRADANIFLITF